MSLYDSPGLAGTASGVSEYGSDLMSDSSEFAYTPNSSNEPVSSATGKHDNSGLAKDLAVKYTAPVNDFVQVSSDDATLYLIQVERDMHLCLSFLEATSFSDPDFLRPKLLWSGCLNNIAGHMKQIYLNDAVPRTYAVDNNIDIKGAAADAPATGIPRLVEGEKLAYVNYKAHSRFSSLRQGEEIRNNHAMAADTSSSYRHRPSWRTRGTLTNSHHPFEKASSTTPNAKTGKETQRSATSSAAQQQKSDIPTAEEIVARLRNAQQQEATKGSFVAIKSAGVGADAHKTETEQGNTIPAEFIGSGEYKDCEKRILGYIGFKECHDCGMWVHPSSEGCCSTCGIHLLNKRVRSHSDSQTEDHSYSDLDIDDLCSDWDLQSEDKGADADFDSFLAGSLFSDSDSEINAANTGSTLMTAMKAVGLDESSLAKRRLLNKHVMELVKEELDRQLHILDSSSTIPKHQKKTNSSKTFLAEEKQHEPQSDVDPQFHAPETKQPNPCADTESPLRKAFITLGLEMYSSVSHEELGSAVLRCIRTSHERSDEFAMASAIIIKHQKLNDCWRLVYKWDEELDRKLLDLKMENPIMPWASIGDDLGIPGKHCKRRFLEIRPKDWKSTANTTKANKGAGKKAKVQIKTTSSRADTAEQGDLGGHRDEGCNCGTRPCICRAGLINQTSPEPAKWGAHHEETATDENANNIWNSASQVPQYASEDTKFSTLYDPNRETSTFWSAGPKATSMKHAWSCASTISEEENDTSTTAARLPVPEAYTVTYCAIVRSGDQELRLPISSKHVSGPEKEIVNDGMRKVWKWVQDMGVGETISLEDSFRLAKDLHGEGEDEDDDEEDEDDDEEEDGDDENDDEEEEQDSWALY